ncbi:hypothetical protein DL96DRAFT_905707 [Flagelloscypha sp. PMI_526]|nr:hypothetical protein DL96DRAFT_905707 [Flagelloscypha sp. PMI_526]
MELDYTDQENLLSQVPEICPNVQKLAVLYVPAADRGLCLRMKQLKCLSIHGAYVFAQYVTRLDYDNRLRKDNDEGQNNQEFMKDSPTQSLTPKLAFHSLTHVYFGGTVPWDGTVFLVPSYLFPSLTHVGFFANPYYEESPPSMIAAVVKEWITKVPSLQWLVLHFDKDSTSEFTPHPLRIWQQHVRSLLPSHPSRTDNRVVYLQMSELDINGNEDQLEFMDRLWAFAENPQKVPLTRDITRFSL